jgi:asparagine synthase (glutamine-hydrolysing)
MLRAAPGAELELSGGLDSRMILAAMPPEARRGRSTITIGVPEEPSDDMKVAQGVAAAEGLNWSVLDVGGVARLDDEGLDELLRLATEGYDHMANPLEKTALIMAGRGRAPFARFGGQNGEILRGFYYPRQPLTAKTSDALARQLIGLRVAVNDRVDPAVLSPKARELIPQAEERLVRQMLGMGETWGEALDRLYLEHRMQNWVGNAASSRLVEYVPLYPFFDPDVLSAAFAIAPAEKLNSRAAYRLITTLDPALAKRPLANGPVPAAQPKSALGARLADLSLDVSRVTDRLKRRLLRRARQTLGSVTVIDQWRRFELRKRLPMHALASTGLFDEAALKRIAGGESTPDRPTLGFLLVAGSLANGHEA